MDKTDGIVMVKNMKDSTDRLKPEGISNWLEYWEKKKETTIPYTYICPCCNKTVSKTDLVGAHVDDSEKVIYITPLCRGCNNVNKTDWFQVKRSVLAKENTRSIRALNELVNRENNKFK